MSSKIMIDHKKNRFVFCVLVTKGDNSLSPPLSVAGRSQVSEQRAKKTQLKTTEKEKFSSCVTPEGLPSIRNTVSGCFKK